MHATRAHAHDLIEWPHLEELHESTGWPNTSRTYVLLPSKEQVRVIQVVIRAAIVTAHWPAEHFTNVSTKDGPWGARSPCTCRTMPSFGIAKLENTMSMMITYDATTDIALECMHNHVGRRRRRDWHVSRSGEQLGGGKQERGSFKMKPIILRVRIYSEYLAQRKREREKEKGLSARSEEVWGRRRGWIEPSETSLCPGHLS